MADLNKELHWIYGHSYQIKESGVSRKLLPCKLPWSSQRWFTRCQLCSIDQVLKLHQFRDCSSEGLYRMSDRSYLVEESRLSQEFQNASLGNCLEESIQLVSVYSSWHSCYTTHFRSLWSIVSFWPQLWQAVAGPRDKIWDLVALVWPIRSMVITTSSALVKCWKFFGGPSVGFIRYSCLPCTAIPHLIWTNLRGVVKWRIYASLN